MPKTIAGREMLTFQELLTERQKNPEFTVDYENARAEVALGVAIAMARESRKISQRDLALRAGIQQPMLARIEKGQLPNVATLTKIASALNAVIQIGPDGRFAIDSPRTLDPIFPS